MTSHDSRLRFSGVVGFPAKLARFQSAVRAVLMLTRGSLTRPLLRSSSGLVFRGRGVSILNPQYISNAGRLVLEDFVEVQGVSRRGISFGRSVSIGRGTTIRPSSYYGGEAGIGLRVGDRSSIGAGGFVGCSGWIEIGDDVMLGPGVRLFSENHAFGDLSQTIKQQGVIRGELVIENDCWIGSGVTLLPNITVGRGSVIAAGSVVNRDVPPYSVVAGVPAKVVRSRGEG
ncbi:MAG TPA: galactoside O-acetyltransferase [Microbacterium sp.]|nr:galactoside O-acetyltransferase [Microbacterium sp.]